MAKEDFKLQKIKEIGAVLGIVSSIVLGLLGYLKDEKESTAKATYKELSTQMEKASQERIQLQKDISAIHGYLAAKAEQDDKVYSLAKNNAKHNLKPLLPKLQSQRNTESKIAAAAIAANQDEGILIVPEIKSAASKFDAKPIEEVMAE